MKTKARFYRSGYEVNYGESIVNKLRAENLIHFRHFIIGVANLVL